MKVKATDMSVEELALLLALKSERFAAEIVVALYRNRLLKQLHLN